MTTAYTSLLGLALPVTGELSGTWGDTVNTAITSLLDTAVAGTTSITTDADITLTTTTGASNQARQAIILWNPASGTATRNITAPAQSKIYTVINASGGTQSIVIRGVGPTTGVTIAKGEAATVAWNGSDFVKVSSSGGAITFTDLTVTGNTILGDAAADTLTVNATSTFNAPVSFAGLVRLPSTGRSAAAALTTTAPAFLYGVASTYTDTTSSGTIAAMAPFYSIAQPTLATSNVTTYTNAATLYIANAPATGGSATITNPYALYVASGANYFAGNSTFASNVTLGDAAADNVTVNGTVTSNLIFTDNTYNIGANGATRPANGWFSRTLTVGQGTSQNWQILAVDYSNNTGAGIADGIYIDSIKAGTYQGIGFDTRYENAGSWAASQAVATIVDGYQGQFRVFTNSGLTAGLAYTPNIRFSIGSTGLAEFRAGVTDPSIVNSITVANQVGSTAYGGFIGQRFVSGDQRQGLFVRGAGSLTLLSQYYIDFLAGQTAVPLAADTGLAMRINANGTIAMGGSTNSSYPLFVQGASASAGSLDAVNLYNSAGSTATVGITFQTGANSATSGIYNATYATNKANLQLRTSDGTSLTNRYVIDGDGVQTWTNVGGSALGTKMTLNATGLGIGGTPVEQFSVTNASGNTYAGMRLVGSNRGGYIDFYNTTYPVSRMITDQSGNYIFASSAGFGTATLYDRLLIDTSGYHYWYNVGVTTGAVKMTLNNIGLGVAGAPQSNYGPLQVYQASVGTESSLGFIGTDNAVISSKYSLVFQVDSLAAQSGRAYTWKHNGKGYSDGDILMNLTADTNQLQVGTTQTTNDANSGTIYPGVVSAKGSAITPMVGDGTGSWICASRSYTINSSFTVTVSLSDTGYGLADIRVGAYSSSGSGYANSLFCYGGHVGAFNLTTVFNVNSGNVTVGSPSISGGNIVFTVTIANTGQSGQAVFMVHDVGATNGKTARITFS
jgi:hypothetical protein